jgi:hypothetical protein
MEDIGIFYCYLVYFTANWYILWPFGIFRGLLVYFAPFWLVVPRKIWQPCLPTYVIDEGFLKPSQPYCLIHNIEQAKPDFHF